ncbi:MAG: response regulator [Chloroherpetonaceae bacterium]|nr:response regulator [Chloroherpetonaceae bacterium]MCS7210059.1 response regulator [Chloroherpetonaceae bacterium]MDW8020620.1 response regulator [Chloroherpetonaceae bacterium]MDW8465001.1 response regulator [Chloroherpetonaceae bacterium]
MAKAQLERNQPSRTPLRLLLVDDDDFVRETVAQSLTLVGYQVHTAASGAAALQKFEALCPDITLLDIRLPDLSGFSVLKALHKLQPHAEIIFITGEGDMALVIDALRSGISDFVPKPLSLETLLPVLENAERRLWQKKASASPQPTELPRLSLSHSALALPIQIQAFGSLVVQIHDRIIYENDWQNLKTAAVFKILLLHHQQVVRTEQLIDCIWPEVSTRSAEVMLFSAISFIRRLFEPNLRVARQSKYIRTHPSGYELNLGTLNVDYWYDVEAFEAALKEAQRSQSAEKYYAAIELYRDEFLKNDAEYEWTSYKRQMLKDLYLNALQVLLSKAQAEQNLAVVIELGHKMLQADHLYEPAYTVLIESYLQQRRPAEAKKVLALCEQNFRMHLGTSAPSYIRELLRGR